MLQYAAPKGVRQWAEIYKLYRRAFPADEQRPIRSIVKRYCLGSIDVWRFTRDGVFVGFFTTINGGGDHILMDYMAVEESQRGTGVGTEILRLIRQHYAGKCLFGEVESVYKECDNKEERIRRKRIY